MKKWWYDARRENKSTRSRACRNATSTKTKRETDWQGIAPGPPRFDRRLNTPRHGTTPVIVV